MNTNTTFSQLYSFPGFRARTRFKCGIKGDPKARVVALVRRKKKRCVRFVGRYPEASTIIKPTGHVTWLPERCGYMLSLGTDGLRVGGAER